MVGKKELADKPLKAPRKPIKLSWDFFSQFTDVLNPEDDENDGESEEESFRDSMQRLKVGALLS